MGTKRLIQEFVEKVPSTLNDWNERGAPAHPWSLALMPRESHTALLVAPRFPTGGTNAPRSVTNSWQQVKHSTCVPSPFSEAL